MSKTALYVASALLILLGLGLLVVGLQADSWLWQAGLAVVFLAMLLSLATRWAPADRDRDGSPEQSQ